ncbi:hypothetical protein Q8A73_006580 [Channa argus]|nr:hypothetical protein Q8A73_006580 [Channa argus]
MPLLNDANTNRNVHTMYLLFRGKCNDIRPPSSSSSIPLLRSIMGLLLKSFPDNRWCFRVQALGSDLKPEQRALEEQRLDLHRRAVTSKHELNSNQASGNTETSVGQLKAVT